MNRVWPLLAVPSHGRSCGPCFVSHEAHEGHKEKQSFPRRAAALSCFVFFVFFVRNAVADPIAAPKPAQVVPLAPAEAPELRRRPGERPPRILPPIEESEALPDPNRSGGLKAVLPASLPTVAPERYDAQAPTALIDRWRLIDSLGLVEERWYDSYHPSTIKGDRPWRVTADGKRQFLSLTITNNSTTELRRLPALIDGAALSQRFWQQSLIASLDYQQGNTTFQPPDWSLRFTPVSLSSYLTVPDGTGRSHRIDSFLGVQELYGDHFLRTVSPRYDFDSLRIGIQPLSSDFRGFLFQDNQLAARLYGTRDGNRWQYNLVYVKRLAENAASGLNDLAAKPRNEDIVLANVYRQDWPVQGFNAQALVAHVENRERRVGHGVSYIAANGDGHLGWLNLTASMSLAAGRQHQSLTAAEARTVLAGFAAAEASIDRDWLRYRLSALYQSGDGDPDDDLATGYDAIAENPIFAGADTAYWSRQSLPFAGGRRLSSRNGLLNGLRSTADAPTANFENPGLLLAGLGSDADLTPTLRLSTNVNHLWFERTATLSRLANTRVASNDIGWDLSCAAIWRPFFTQNVVLRLSGAWLIPGDGLRAAYPDSAGYSLLGNFIFTY